MTSKYSCLQTVFSVSEYAKTHLQQFVISKFWIPAPDAPLHDRTRGLIYWTPPGHRMPGTPLDDLPYRLCGVYPRFEMWWDRLTGRRPQGEGESGVARIFPTGVHFFHQKLTTPSSPNNKNFLKNLTFPSPRGALQLTPLNSAPIFLLALRGCTCTLYTPSGYAYEGSGVYEGRASPPQYRRSLGKDVSFLPTPKKFVIFSERELMFMFAICRRPSVCLSVVCLSSVVCNVRAPYSGN